MRYRLRTLMIVMAILSTYLASYRALMQPTLYWAETSSGEIVSAKKSPGYEIHGAIAHFLFYPLERIDHMLRPAFWNDVTEIVPIHQTQQQDKN